MVIALILARYLGPADFGRYAFVLTYIALFQIVAELGLELILVRHIAQEPALRDSLFGSGFGLRLFSGFACWLAATALVPLLSDTTYVRLTAVAGVALVGTAGLAFRVLYRVSLRIDYLLAQMSFNALVTATCVAIALRSGGGTMAAVAANSAGTMLTLGLAIVLGRRLSAFRPRWEPARWRTLVRESLPLGINAVLVSLAFRLGPLVLLRLGGAEDVAYFTAASKLVEALCLVPEVPMLTIFPLMSALHRESEERFRSLSRAALVWIMVLSLPAVLVVGGLAAPLMNLLYGPLYSGAVPVLQLLVWATAFAATGAVWMGVLTALHLQRWLLRSYAVATAVNLIGALILVPRFGSTGAAAASVLGALSAQVLLGLLPETRPHTRQPLLAIAPLLGVCVVASAVVPRWVASPYAATAIMLAVYAVGLLFSGALGPEERAFARRVLRRAPV